jgi:hypothetical protein
VPYKFCSDPLLRGVLYTGGSYSKGGSYMLVYTVLAESKEVNYVTRLVPFKA